MPLISKHHSTTATSSQPTNTPITKKTIANQTKQISNQSFDSPKSILKSTCYNKQSSQGNKEVKFSMESEIKYFDQNESSLFLPPIHPSQKMPFDRTKQKTVKMEDIKQLKESVITKLDDINQRTSVIEADLSSARLTKVIQLKKELSSITDSLNTYQALLNSSTYHHHKNKQTTLTLLKSKVLITNHQLDFLEFQVRRPQIIQTKNQ